MSSSGGLTTQQKRLLDFLDTFIVRNGVSPSYSDIQKALNMRSKASVSRYLTVLKERGFVDFARGKARTITVLFPLSSTPNWESIARALYLQNIDLREHLKKLGWDVDVKAMTLPESKRGKRNVS